MKINWHKLFTLGASSDTANYLIAQADAKGSEAQNNLGVLFAASSPESQAAVLCFRKAAEKGYAPAQTNLAQMYAQGKGLPKDPSEAIKWFRRAAMQGDAGAQFQLGRALHRQSLDSKAAGLNEARIEGFMWLQLASGQGFFNAQSACEQLNLKMSNTELEEGKRRVSHFVPAPEKSSA
jgi:TPR repeat protein